MAAWNGGRGLASGVGLPWVTSEPCYIFAVLILMSCLTSLIAVFLLYNRDNKPSLQVV